MIQPSLLHELKHNEKIVLDVLDQLNEQHAALRQQEGSWTVLELLEHTFISEKGIFKGLKQLSVPSNHDSPKQNIGRDKILQIMLDDTNSYPAPTDINPKARFSSLNEFRHAFFKHREQLTTALAKGQIVLGAASMPHPTLGELTITDWLYLIIGHALRHLRQIVRVVQQHEPNTQLLLPPELQNS
jgi:hypothetical protein